MKVVQGFNREEYSREKFENHLEGHAGGFYMQLDFKIIFGLQWIYAEVLELQ